MLHRRALNDAGVLVAQAAPADLERQTPCPGRDLGDLLAHLVGQNRGFAAAIATGDASASTFMFERSASGVRIDPAAEVELLASEWVLSATAVLAAVAAAQPQRQIRLIEVDAGHRFPLARVIGIHLVDTVVHSWDVAQSLDRDDRPDLELLAAVSERARSVPSGDARTAPGAAFGPEHAVVEHGHPDTGGDAWADALARLGRADGVESELSAALAQLG